MASDEQLNEPVFRQLQPRALYVPNDEIADLSAEDLAHQVSRNPKALQSHIQRIHLAVAQKNVDKTYGALLDLLSCWVSGAML